MSENLKQFPKYHEILDKEQLLLLDIFLRSESKAILAWEKWKSNYSFDNIYKRMSAKLLPAVYNSIKNHEKDKSILEPFKLAHIQCWHLTQLMLPKLFTIIKTLQENDIQPILLKGAARIIQKPGDIGIRQMSDADLLVPKRFFIKAQAILQEKKLIKFLETFYHSDTYELSVGIMFDLHHRLFEWNMYSDEEIINRAVTIVYNDNPVKILEITDQFYHCIAHAGNGVWPKSLYWISDAIEIYNSSNGNINWDQIEELAGRRKMRRMLQIPLEILSFYEYLPIPENFMCKFQKKHHSFLERTETFAKETGIYTPYGGLIFQILAFIRLRHDERWNFPILGFVPFLKHRFKCNSWKQFIATLVYKLFYIPMRSLKKLLDFSRKSKFHGKYSETKFLR